MVTAVSTFKNMIKFPAASAPGTGSFAVIAGANSPPYRDITNFTSGDTVSYEATDGSDQESGQGIATDNGGGSWTITRVNIWDSSNSGAAVNFTNAPTIKCDALAADLASLNWVDGQFFGDGSDGDVTVSGAVSLTRDMQYRNLTLAAGAALNTAGYKFFVQQIFDISAAPAGAVFNGTNAAVNASGATGGAGTNVNTTGHWGIPGASGANLSTAGTTGTVNAGTTPSDNLGTSQLTYGGYQGGDGGKGGDGSAGAKAGGAARAAQAASYTAGAPINSFIAALSLCAAQVNVQAAGTSCLAAIPGQPGSSGGGATTTFSGGGGGGAGPGGRAIFIFARTIARGSNSTAGIFNVKGSAGGTGGDGTGAAAGGGGGGGGGAGGFLLMCFRFLTGSTITGAIDVSGGSGGPGGNGSTTGNGGDQAYSGAAGRAQLMNLSTMGITTTLGTQTRNAGNAASGTTGGSGQTAFAAQISL